MSQPFDFDAAVQQARAGQDIQELAQRLLTRLSNDERLHLLDGDLKFWPGLSSMITDYNRTVVPMGAVPRLKIPGILFTDGPRGIVMGSSTAFPTSIARGATWDVNLEYRIGQAVGLEGRAQGANFYGGVCVNLPRHPAWGRTQETYSEDPVPLGQLGAALARGSGQHLMPCVKHFALNSMENARFKVNVKIREDVLHEVFLPHFKQVIDEGGPAVAVMSAYNKVNGVYCGQNQYLLTEVLRKMWKFPGVVITDFLLGLRDGVLSVKAGCDIEAPVQHHRHAELPAALRKGDLAMSDVNAACLRILATQLLHYTTRSTQEPAMDVVFCEAHRELAREAASRSIVLLKNDSAQSGQPLLPLDLSTLRSVAVIGRLADRANLGDHGSSNVRSPSFVSPYAGLKHALANTSVRTTLTTSDDISEAVKAAKQADITVLIVGNTADDEGENLKNVQVPMLPWPSFKEFFKYVLPIGYKLLVGGVTNTSDAGHKQGDGGDRDTVRLRKKDIDLITAVSQTNPRVIVSVITAGAVIVEPWHQHVPTLLYSWYNGCEGGTALADVLLGNINPSGRMPYAIAKDETDLPFFDADADEIEYDRWFGQRLIDRNGSTASFPLGFGLSYTQFLLSDAVIVAQTEESFQIQLSVLNSGRMDGQHVVQVYGCLQSASDDLPHRQLLGFASVHVKQGEKQSVLVTASTQPLKRWSITSQQFVWVSRQAEIEVSSYSGDAQSLRLCCTF